MRSRILPITAVLIIIAGIVIWTFFPSIATNVLIYWLEQNGHKNARLNVTNISPGALHIKNLQLGTQNTLKAESIDVHWRWSSIIRGKATTITIKGLHWSIGSSSPRHRQEDFSFIDSVLTGEAQLLSSAFLPPFPFRKINIDHAQVEFINARNERIRFPFKARLTNSSPDRVKLRVDTVFEGTHLQGTSEFNFNSDGWHFNWKVSDPSRRNVRMNSGSVEWIRGKRTLKTKMDVGSKLASLLPVSKDLNLDFGRIQASYVARLNNNLKLQKLTGSIDGKELSFKTFDSPYLGAKFQKEKEEQSIELSIEGQVNNWQIKPLDLSLPTEFKRWKKNELTVPVKMLVKPSKQKMTDLSLPGESWSAEGVEPIEIAGQIDFGTRDLDDDIFSATNYSIKAEPLVMKTNIQKVNFDRNLRGLENVRLDIQANARFEPNSGAFELSLNPSSRLFIESLYHGETNNNKLGLGPLVADDTQSETQTSIILRREDYNTPIEYGIHTHLTEPLRLKGRTEKPILLKGVSLRANGAIRHGNVSDSSPLPNRARLLVNNLSYASGQYDVHDLRFTVPPPNNSNSHSSKPFPKENETEISIKGFSYDGAELPGFQLDVKRPESNKLTLSGDWNLVDDGSINIQGQMHHSTAGTHLQVGLNTESLKLREGDTIQLFVEEITGVKAIGHANVEANLTRTPHEFNSGGHLNLKDMSIQDSSSSYRITDGSLRMNLNSLFPPVSPPAQKFGWDTAKFGEFEFEAGMADFRIHDLDLVSVQDARGTTPKEGTIQLKDVKFNPFSPDIETELTVKALPLKVYLPLFTQNRATGSGKLDGNVKFRVSSRSKVPFKIKDGFMKSPGRGTIRLRDNTELKNLLIQQLENKAQSQNQNYTQLVKRRIIRSLQNFEYDTLKLNLVREDEDLSLKTTLKGRGQDVPQELHLNLNFRGLDPVISMLVGLSDKQLSFN